MQIFSVEECNACLGNQHSKSWLFTWFQILIKDKNMGITKKSKKLLIYGEICIYLFNIISRLPLQKLDVTVYCF